MNSMVTSEKSTQSSVATREKILDAAERLFIEKGFTATSLRAIASLSGVNLAAAHYHFGSKEALFEAAIHRRVRPINEIRLQALDQLEAGTGVISVQSILAAFFKPFTQGDVSSSVPQLIGRIYGEPKFITKALLEREFGVVVSRFSGALARALPEVDEAEILWRFHFMIGSMIRVLSFDGPIGISEVADPLGEGMSRLQSFAAAGFLQTQPTNVIGED